MSAHWVSICTPVGMLVLATVLPIDTGVIAGHARNPLPSGRRRCQRNSRSVAVMAVSSTVVDVSSSPRTVRWSRRTPRGADRNVFFRQLAVYGAIVTVMAAVVVWLLFVVL